MQYIILNKTIKKNLHGRNIIPIYALYLYGFCVIILQMQPFALIGVEPL